VQEMLRAERIFEAKDIDEELNAYNPMIPDGNNWKATFMIEYPDENERRIALARLIDIEDRVWMQVAGHPPVYAIADEDLERETDEKTSSVHFLRFELDASMVSDALAGKPISAGIDHENYRAAIEPLPASIADALRADLA